MKFRLSIIGLALIYLFLPVSIWAQDGIGGALSQLKKISAQGSRFEAGIVAADFDNDQKPDAAILQNAGLLDGKRAFRVQVHLTAGDNHAITFLTAEAGLTISAFDVDRDGATDIVIENAFTHKRLQIYLNNGHGAFRQAKTEDYQTSDPSEPNWHAQLSWGLPIIGLPPSRNIELGILRRSSMLNRDAEVRASFRLQTLLVQSGPRAPSDSRAPPSFLSL